MRVYAEFDNVAKYSKYPFSDICSLVDVNDNHLPLDFLLDMSMCVRGSGAVQLQSLSHGSGVFSISGTEVATFSYSGPGATPIIDVESGNEIGVAVLGPSATGAEEFLFDDGAAVLCPSCFCSFTSDCSVGSISAGNDSEKLRGNVKIRGKGGVYVTKIGANTLRVDIVGPVIPVSVCYSDPIYRLIVIGLDCPMSVAGTILSPVSGVIALRSAFSADEVCNKKELQIDEQGRILALNCVDPSPDLPDEDPCIDDYGPFFVTPMNGNIEFVPYSTPQDGPSPVLVEVHKADVASAASVASKLLDSDAKDLAIAGNSGSIVIGLKGRT